MANYYGVTRTNYFAVTDEDAFRQIIAGYSNPKMLVFEKVQQDGTKLFGFGCYASLDSLKSEDGEPEDCEEADVFYEELQGVLQEGHSIMVCETGHENLRYLISRVIVITKHDIQFIDLGDQAIRLARNMLNDEGYNPIMHY